MHPPLFIYYISFLVFPYTILLSYRLIKKRKIISLNGFVFVLCMLFIWARFIEPQWLKIKETTIPGTGINARIVLIADIHAGPYKGRYFVERLVNRVNMIDAQFNIIAGDFILQTPLQELLPILEPLKTLNRPTYFVMGNHDMPAPDVKAALTQLGLIDIEHQLLDFESFQLTGVGDRWNQDDTLKSQLPSKPTLLVAHNPDSTLHFSQQQIRLVLSGHTHCGQIRIPYIYKKIIPSEYGFDCYLEYAQTAAGTIPVYITPGVGETALPLRFLNPSTIDVLTLTP